MESCHFDFVFFFTCLTASARVQHWALLFSLVSCCFRKWWRSPDRMSSSSSFDVILEAGGGGRGGGDADVGHLHRRFPAAMCRKHARHFLQNILFFFCFWFGPIFVRSFVSTVLNLLLCAPTSSSPASISFRIRTRTTPFPSRQSPRRLGALPPPPPPPSCFPHLAIKYEWLSIIVAKPSSLQSPVFVV